MAELLDHPRITREKPYNCGPISRWYSIVAGTLIRFHTIKDGDEYERHMTIDD